MKKVGLFFGSFNPIHIGHLAIANAMVQNADIDQVWFIVSPQNPFKKNKGLLHEFDRLDMVRAAIDDNNSFRASDIEFSMPKPSYTIDTLTVLTEKYPDIQFSLIIGQDNLTQFNNWKNAGKILEYFDLLVYPRVGEPENELMNHDKVTIVEAPLFNISASFLRKAIKANQSIKYLVHPEVERLIKEKNYYK